MKKTPLRPSLRFPLSPLSICFLQRVNARPRGRSFSSNSVLQLEKGRNKEATKKSLGRQKGKTRKRRRSRKKALRFFLFPHFFSFPQGCGLGDRVLCTASSVDTWTLKGLPSLQQVHRVTKSRYSFPALASLLSPRAHPRSCASEQGPRAMPRGSRYHQQREEEPASATARERPAFCAAGNS